MRHPNTHFTLIPATPPMLGLISTASNALVLAPARGSKSAIARAPSTKMLYGEPRPVQIIPSVLPADWANMGAECKRLEDAGALPMTK